MIIELSLGGMLLGPQRSPTDSLKGFCSKASTTASPSLIAPLPRFLMFFTPTTRKTSAPTSKRDRKDTHKATPHRQNMGYGKELRMVPLWATEGAADTPSPSCGAVIYLCGYVFM